MSTRSACRGIAAATCAILAGASAARAQVATATQAGSPSVVTTSGRADPPAPKGWALFDPYNSRHGTELSAGPVWWKPAREAGPVSTMGFELGIGQAQTTIRRPFIVGGRVELVLHALDSKSYAFSLPRYTFVGGLALGPVEPEIGIGVTLFTLDAFHGDYSAGMLTPAVSGGVRLKLGALHLAARVYSEYWWRWFGDVDYRLQGLVFNVGLDLEPGRSTRTP